VNWYIVAHGERASGKYEYLKEDEETGRRIEKIIPRIVS